MNDPDPQEVGANVILGIITIAFIIWMLVKFIQGGQ